MAFDLCQVRQAAKPYYIESISTNIYSIEELCFYLYENIFLIDHTIVNEALCDWIRDELGLKKLYRQLYDQLEKQQGISYFVLPILREIGYLPQQEMRELQERISKLEVQPGDARQKLKGDYLARSRMFGSAIHEYYQILDRRGPGNLGAQFYAEIWNNLGCVYARLFLFEEAADCFLRAWKLVRTKEALRKYVSALPMFLPDEEYRKKLEELDADSYLVARIQEYNAKICRDAEESEGMKRLREEAPDALLEELKEEYRRSAKC